MRELVSGVLAAGFGVAALHFLRFWRQGADRLFVLFGAAFGLMAVNSVLLGLTGPEDEVRVLLYGIRLVAFVLILVAIADKNRSSSR